MQRGLYRRFAYAISDRSSGHGGGRWASGILSKAAIQMCLEDLFVRTLRKVLLVHDSRSRSIGWRRENICRHRIRHRIPLTVEIVLQLTSYRTSKGVSGSTEGFPALRSFPDPLASHFWVAFPGVLDLGPLRGTAEPGPCFPD